MINTKLYKVVYDGKVTYLDSGYFLIKGERRVVYENTSSYIYVLASSENEAKTNARKELSYRAVDSITITNVIEVEFALYEWCGEDEGGVVLRLKNDAPQNSCYSQYYHIIDGISIKDIYDGLSDEKYVGLEFIYNVETLYDMLKELAYYLNEKINP